MRQARFIPFLLLWLLTGCVASAQDRPVESFESQWREFRIPPFEVIVERDTNDARAFLGDLFQFRHLLVTAFPGKELKAQWPIRIWILNGPISPPQPAAQGLPVVVDRYVAVLGSPPHLTAALRHQIAQTILHDNLRPMPAWFERGLLSLLGGASIDGQVIRLAEPVDPEHRILDWARVFALLASKESVPALSALTGNLEKGMEIRLALRNSYQTDFEKLEAQARAVLARGAAKPVLFSGLANNPRQDFRDWYVPLGYSEFARLSLLASHHETASLQKAVTALRPRYGELDPRARVEIEAIDAFDALAAGESEEAARQLKALTSVGLSRSARVYLEAAKLSKDAAEKKRLAARAREFNPNWAEVDRLLASLETNPAAHAKLLYQAARLDPRNRALWEETAAAAEKARDFAMADAALEGAERSAIDDAEKAKLRERRWSLRDRRAKKEEEDRQSKLAEDRKEIEALKAVTMSRIDAALARANKQNESPGVEKLEIVKYGDLDQKETVTGRLIRIECRSGGNLVLELESETERTRLLLPDASKVKIEGGAALSFRCGAQSPVQTLTAEYMPKTNAVLGTIGEVQVLRPEAASAPVAKP
ncbi:MAG: hypothetical protein IT169_08070 [Bryobacterales bacterium]|nr:hypothetical protein [Bryobacterales bacterium]